MFRTRRSALSLCLDGLLGCRRWLTADPTARSFLCKIPLTLAFLSMLTVATGCGGSSGGPDVATVSGKVTLDGKPLPNAQVYFQPDSGRPSSGTTDASGNYFLSYAPGQEGALVGNHIVTIRTEVSDGDGRPPKVAEFLPPKYHNQTELKATVTAGKNVQDFPLQSK